VDHLFVVIKLFSLGVTIVTAEVLRARGLSIEKLKIGVYEGRWVSSGPKF